MKNKNRPSNMLITFIMMIAFASILFSFTYLLTGRTKDIGHERNKSKAFWIAEAGVHKALWSLSTPSGLGGYGNSWRPTAFTETFAGGSYSFSIFDGTVNSFTIFSTGEINGVKVTVIQRMRSSELPAAFDYGIYNNGNLTLKGSAVVKGDVFANGNIEIEKSSNLPTGETYTTAGHTVNGVPGTVPVDVPVMPTLNSTYYDNKISFASSQPSGNLDLDNYDLAGTVVFINGDSTITGNITGGGIIVVTGDTVIDGATISPNTTIISNGEMTIKGGATVQSGGILYSPEKISIPGNPRISGAIMSAAIDCKGTPTIYGILYSWAVSTAMDGTVNVYGSVVNPSSTTYNGNITVEFDKSYLPAAPPGLAAGGYSTTRGSWRGE